MLSQSHPISLHKSAFVQEWVRRTVHGAIEFLIYYILQPIFWFTGTRGLIVGMTFVFYVASFMVQIM